MADNDLRQLARLLDRKLSPLKADLTGLKREFVGVNNRLDLVARHLAKVDSNQQEHSRQLATQDEALDRIERQGVKKDDRLNDHGERMEKLEAKTAHLPPRS